MRNKPFHLGTVLHNAWRTVIQIGVAAWRNIWKTPRTAQQRQEIFQDTWASTTAFCSMTHKPMWHFIPPAEYLPQDLAVRPSTGAPRQQIPIIQASSNPSSANGTTASLSLVSSELPQDTQARPHRPRLVDADTEGIGLTIDLAAANNDWTDDYNDSDIGNNENNVTPELPTLLITQEPTTQSHQDTAARRRMASQQANHILHQILLDIERDQNQEEPEVDVQLQDVFSRIYRDLGEE